MLHFSHELCLLTFDQSLHSIDSYDRHPYPHVDGCHSLIRIRNIILVLVALSDTLTYHDASHLDLLLLCRTGLGSMAGGKRAVTTTRECARNSGIYGHSAIELHSIT